MAAATFDIVEIATQVIEAAAGLGAIYTEVKMLGVARNYYQLYKNQKEFYYSTFQYGVEAPLAQQVFAVPYLVLDYGNQVDTITNVETGALHNIDLKTLAWWNN